MYIHVSIRGLCMCVCVWLSILYIQVYVFPCVLCFVHTLLCVCNINENGVKILNLMLSNIVMRRHK
jgi:hypothetical protein